MCISDNLPDRLLLFEQIRIIILYTLMKVMPVKPPDKGLLLSSRVDFTIPSPFAREHLYYLIQYGCYQCVPGYEVRRDFLDMFLCIYVRSGAPMPSAVTGPPMPQRDSSC